MKYTDLPIARITFLRKLKLSPERIDFVNKISLHARKELLIPRPHYLGKTY